MEPLQALALATAIYAAVLFLTLLALVAKSPPGYRRIKAAEVAAVLLISAVFFALGYLLLVGLK
ncbi:hypothetical protein [Pyrobaculum neutrophilum]|uniref:Uncharacterized protein n=1 Tax=Pyrobaculum neutrophilum (strain DSM 2338 / JCM 9278 / NBRC 100436 / V24Sta) TaxID=444157 RepID=B1YAQ9_PYRNV|nr:hypothetical protein [Pyrobaculum neutrophilum]ACB39138.1 hypothetical protein Tneu_0182 [Pyrobaculum neutrophilum V24Sta]